MKVEAQPKKGKKGKKRKAEADPLETEIADSLLAFDKVMNQYSSKLSFKSIANEIVDLTEQEEDEEGKEESSSNRRSSRNNKKLKK